MIMDTLIHGWIYIKHKQQKGQSFFFNILSSLSLVEGCLVVEDRCLLCCVEKKVSKYLHWSIRSNDFLQKYLTY